MYKKIKPFFLIVETPLHAGSGTDLGIVDMPIQRERHTGFPKIEASGLKGCIREAFEDANGEIQIGNQKVNNSNRKSMISLTFGPENGDEHAGALGFTDARILFFPVKSMKGVFAWITCPKVLERFKNDLKLCGISNIPQISGENSVPYNSKLIIKDDKIVLEEYTFQVIKDKDINGICSKLAEWFSRNIIPADVDYNYWREKIKEDIVVLSNDDFKDFVNLSTEVITRIKINSETGTVERGALFTEEYLPSESILYSLALTTPIFKEKEEEKGIFGKNNGGKGEDLVMEYFAKGLRQVIQIGGNSTIGKGIVRTRIWGG
jgi:CRISPR-associated protein Cmr4